MKKIFSLINRQALLCGLYFLLWSLLGWFLANLLFSFSINSFFTVIGTNPNLVKIKDWVNDNNSLVNIVFSVFFSYMFLVIPLMITLLAYIKKIKGSLVGALVSAISAYAWSFLISSFIPISTLYAFYALVIGRSLLIFALSLIGFYWQRFSWSQCLVARRLHQALWFGLLVYFITVFVIHTSWFGGIIETYLGEIISSLDPVNQRGLSNLILFLLPWLKLVGAGVVYYLASKYFPTRGNRDLVVAPDLSPSLSPDRDLLTKDN